MQRLPFGLKGRQQPFVNRWTAWLRTWRENTSHTQTTDLSEHMPLQKPPLLRDDVAAVLQSAQQLVIWIAERQDGLEIKTDNAIRIPGVLFDLCLEHHVGIVQLVTSRINGSAFALIRSQFESLVRGLWLSLIATADEVQEFVEKDRLPLKFGEMLDVIEQHADFGDTVLSHYKIGGWKPMNSYTHGGMHQVSRRIKTASIEPNYQSEEVIEVLKLSGLFALLALLQIGRLANNEKVIAEVDGLLSGELFIEQAGMSSADLG